MERRQFARIQVNLQLKFKTLETLGGMIEGSTSDLSQGGIFLRTCQVRPVGTRLEMQIPIPNADPVLLVGTVRSVRYQGEKPEGMGIEFDELRDPARGVILHLINSGAEKPPKPEEEEMIVTWKS